MINVNKLKGKIVERGLSVQDVAKAIGISTASLYRKMDPSGSTMYIHEAYEISRVLKLTLDEVNAIFFLPIQSHKMRQSGIRFRNRLEEQHGQFGNYQRPAGRNIKP